MDRRTMLEMIAPMFCFQIQHSACVSKGDSVFLASLSRSVLCEEKGTEAVNDESIQICLCNFEFPSPR